jgi:UDP-glucose 4-epimerase
MRTIVTGGAGFIGSHLVEELIKKGDQVLVIDNLSTGSLNNLEDIDNTNLTIEIISVEDSFLVETAIRRFKPDRIFHLAAQVSVPQSLKAPLSDFKTNSLGATVVFEAASKYNVKRIVFSSTGGAIYGDAEIIPTPETAEALPMSPYGQHKLLAEVGAGFYLRQQNLQITVLRFANVYGPRQGGSGESGVISLFTDAALKETPATIYGDGEQTRDFVFVKDVVEALILASTAPSANGPYNIGSNFEITINQLVKELQNLGLNINPRYARGNPGEVNRSLLSSKKIKDDLGWQAKTPFKEGLKTTIKEMKAKPRVDTKKSLFCVDVGGQTIHSANIKDNHPVEIETVTAQKNLDPLFDQLSQLVGPDTDWALSLPGTVSSRRYWTNSSAYSLMDKVVDLEKEFRKRNVNPPLLVENDAFVLARGAALQNLRISRLAVLNIGFGLGGGLAINGWPERGVAQEIGHIPLPGNNKKCLCGKTGCVSTVLSMQGISKETDITTATEFKGAVDQFENEYQQAQEALIFLLQATKLILSPGAIALSGGLFWELFENDLDQFEAELDKTTITSPGATGTLIAMPGPEIALEGIYDLAMTGY